MSVAVARCNAVHSVEFPALIHPVGWNGAPPVAHVTQYCDVHASQYSNVQLVPKPWKNVPEYTAVRLPSLQNVGPIDWVHSEWSPEFTVGPQHAPDC